MSPYHTEYWRSSKLGVVAGVVLIASAGSALAGPCTGPGAPTTTETKCLTAVLIPGNPLRSFDISWVNPHRGEYYLADRSNAGVDIIDTDRKSTRLNSSHIPLSRMPS